MTTRYTPTLATATKRCVWGVNGASGTAPIASAIRAA